MSSLSLSFVLLSQNAYPDPADVIAEADRLGVGLTHEMGEPTMLNFSIAGGGLLIVMHVDAPHPDAATMPVGPTSPEPSIIAGHVGHYVATAMNVPDGAVHQDVLMGIVTAALIRASPAVAAMLGHGAIFHRSDVFAAFVEAAGSDIASEITVDITAAKESEDRMSFLTHGLDRYDREEFYVTSSVDGQGALDYVMALVKWMIADPDKVLPTGDTVGRTADERIIVQRVPRPNRRTTTRHSTRHGHQRWGPCSRTAEEEGLVPTRLVDAEKAEGLSQVAGQPFGSVSVRVIWV